MNTVFTHLSQADLVSAATYFPAIAGQLVIENKLSEDELNLVAENKKILSELDSKEKVVSLIDKYFDIKKYGDLTKLTSLQWATQLIIRKKILDHLNQPKESTNCTPSALVGPDWPFD